MVFIEFQINGQPFQAINGGPEFPFTEAVSFSIACANQDEVDYYWDTLTEEGEPSQCGWLKDKYGVSWQVVPTVLTELLRDADRERAGQVMRRMLQMTKLDVAELQAAYERGRGEIGRKEKRTRRGFRDSTSRRITVDRLSEKETHMARTSTYLNFARSTEEAFNFYKSVFGTEFVGEIARFGDVPAQEGQPPMSDDDKQLVMNVQLPILGGHLLMGTRRPGIDGLSAQPGEQRLHLPRPGHAGRGRHAVRRALGGGKVEMAMQEMFWGDYFGSLVDKFGVQLDDQLHEQDVAARRKGLARSLRCGGKPLTVGFAMTRPRADLRDSQ